MSIELQTISPFLEKIEDVDGNGILSSGDHLHGSKGDFFVLESHIASAQKLAATLSYYTDRRFFVVNDSSAYIDVTSYLGYSQTNNAGELEALLEIGHTEEISDGESSSTYFLDTPDTEISLANITPACGDSASTKRYTKLVQKHGELLSAIREKWAAGEDVIPELARKRQVEEKIARFEKRKGC